MTESGFFVLLKNRAENVRKMQETKVKIALTKHV